MATKEKPTPKPTNDPPVRLDAAGDPIGPKQDGGRWAGNQKVG